MREQVADELDKNERLSGLDGIGRGLVWRDLRAPIRDGRSLFSDPLAL